MAEETEAQVIADTATAAAVPHELDAEALHSVVLPHGATLQVLELEKYRAAPWAKKGALTLFTASALGEYVNRHKDDRTVLYADVEARSITAVLNDHAGASSSPGWADHRATLVLRHDPTWKRWTGNDGSYMAQEAFAEFIEEAYPDIVSPPAADMLELAQTLQATAKVEFRSQTLLANGQRQLRYEETVDAKAGQKGQLEVPSDFEVALIPFEGCDPYRVTAHLRLRLNEGNLRIGYVLQRPEDVIRSAFADILGTVESATDALALAGAAPTARR